MDAEFRIRTGRGDFGAVTLTASSAELLQASAAWHPAPTGFYTIYGKRIFDIAIALVALLLLSPVMLATAAIVAFADGLPVIYRQKRAGMDLAPFVIFKFRTMFRDADSKCGSWKKSDPEWNGAEDAKPAKDPRIIRGGRFLRQASLDELPQLVNVLRGDMSIIGPRPLLLSQVADNSEIIGDLLMRRAMLRPGITGLWQVSGRSNLSFDHMMALDIEYVQGLSFRRDLVILLKTVKVVLHGIGAA